MKYRPLCQVVVVVNVDGEFVVTVGGSEPDPIEGPGFGNAIDG
jgi:hypothetical protein